MACIPKHDDEELRRLVAPMFRLKLRRQRHRTTRIFELLHKRRTWRRGHHTVHSYNAWQRQFMRELLEKVSP